MGSTTLQTRLRVDTAVKGSMQAVAGSGTANISLLWIAFHPLMDEPSNPDPSLNVPSFSSSTGIVKCCHVPSRSTNLRSTTCTLCFFVNSNTSWEVIPSLLSGPFMMMNTTTALQVRLLSHPSHPRTDQSPP